MCVTKYYNILMYYTKYIKEYIQHANINTIYTTLYVNMIYQYYTISSNTSIS